MKPFFCFRTHKGNTCFVRVEHIICADYKVASEDEPSSLTIDLVGDANSAQETIRIEGVYAYEAACKLAELSVGTNTVPQP